MTATVPVEEVIDPALPICDPHHHLWDRHGNRYLLDELLADTGQADARGARHNVRSTVFVECASMYRADGPEPLRPVGETEFVNGIAAMSASGGYGDTRVAAGIVSFADLCLGAAVREVLQAHIDAARGRFRGIRHAAGWHASEQIRNSHSNPVEHLLLDATFREGFAQLAPLGLSFDAWLFHPQLPELTDLARAFPDTTIVLDHFGGPLGIGPYAGQADAVYADWKRDIDALARCPNVVAKLGGLAMPINGFDWHKRAAEAHVAATGRRHGTVLPAHHRAFRPRALHVREQLPRGQGVVLVPGVVEQLQAAGGRLQCRREGGAVPRHRRARVPAACLTLWSVNANEIHSHLMNQRLDELDDGAHATVRGVSASSPDLDAAMLRRLAELGFIAGEPVQVLRRGPGGRDPLAVRVGDTLFALRRAEARCIEVQVD